MTGHEDFNFPAFHEAAQRLRNKGYSIFNPAESFKGNTSLPWTTYMEHDYKAIMDSSAVMCLEGWEGSLGAVLEVLFALSIGKNVFKLTGYGSERLFSNSDNARQMVEDLLQKIEPKNESKDEMSILEEAQSLVHGNRGDAYGHPLDDFSKSALIMNAVLYDKLKPGCEIVAEDVPLIMQGVKISRETNKPKRDNRVDGAGYWETLDMVVEERSRRKSIAAHPSNSTNKRVVKISSAIEDTLSKYDMSGDAWDDYDKNGKPYWNSYDVYNSLADLDQRDRFGRGKR